MATKLIRKYSAITLMLLAGCSSEVQVSVDGFGSVTTAAGDFNCWAGTQSCVSSFEKHITLVARDPTDGSATFSQWSGACSGTARECTLSKGGRVQAHFIPAHSVILNPAQPVIQAVTGLSPTRVSILWQAAKEENRAQENLSYLVYVSADKENLLSKNNLVSTIAGNMFGEYSFQYEVAQATDLTLQDRVLHVAVAVRDEQGNLGEPAYRYDVNLQQLQADMGYHVITQKSPAPPPEGDGEI